MKNRYSGFTLIEIMIAVAVAAVLFPAVIGLMSTSTFSTSQGENYTKAYALAQNRMESFYSQRKTTGWDSIPLGTASSTDGIYTIDENVSLISTDEKKILINISWDERNVLPKPKVGLESIIANIRI